jgi:hypothetical protein
MLAQRGHLMSRIPAGFSQLKKAYEIHWENASRENGLSYYLLKFYSVECGLKSMYIHKYDRSHSRSIEDMHKDHGHKLDRLVKELNIPASQIGEPPRFRIKRGGQAEPQRDIERVHEAWRYGVAIDQDDEIAILRWLDQVSKWIRDGLKEA